MIEIKDVIEKHGLKRYVAVRQKLSNRFATVINSALDVWKSHATTRRFCIPALFHSLGNYYDDKYKKDSTL